MAFKWLLGSALIQVLGTGEETGKEQEKGRSTHDQAQKSRQESAAASFQMPLHYPRYTRADYEKMEEWKLDRLLQEYGMNCRGSLHEKRAFAVGAFLWPGQR